MIPVRERDYELVVLARAVVGAGSAQAGGLLRSPRGGETKRGQAPTSPGLSPLGVTALQRTFSVGLVRALARGGGSRREQVAGRSGRLWERHDAPRLTVTALPVELLSWCLAEPLALPSRAPCPARPATEAGDVALVYLLARLLAADGLASVLEERVFAANPLVQLAFADRLAFARERRPEGDRARPDGQAPMADALAAFLGTHGLLVEAFAGWLAQDIVASDRPAASVSDAIAISARRRATYEGWITACERAGRLDLALPLVDASVAAMGKPSHPVLDEGASLRDRAEAARGGNVLCAVVLRLSRHVDALGALDFFDDGYADATALRRRWARLEAARPVAEARIQATAGV